MRLFCAPTSPFARKVRVIAHELGPALELVQTDPWTSAELRVLIPLVEATLICEFLNHRASGFWSRTPVASPNLG
jgi:glutathione S-transferase